MRAGAGTDCVDWAQAVKWASGLVRWRNWLAGFEQWFGD
ncbi:hypothetical protein TIFTF001_032951 [Ficus carica]|uniref:Uncharacterized protein n=1 Tax=Ficus carica TaxID=3494 RepID=A0AA88DYA8_FICCA|nr:hypothetical protein TIFTF001_032951 [Ficus carica]